MKERKTRRVFSYRWLSMTAIILLLATLQISPAQAVPLSDGSNPVPAAAMKLVQFCMNPNMSLDSQAVATLVDYVVGQKPGRESALPQQRQATGAYYEFDTRIPFQNFLKYSYSNQIPSVLTSPASLRYSLWTGAQKLPGAWPTVSPDGRPVVVRGIERIGITPDLNTGVHYKYDVKKTLVLLNHDGRQVLFSIAKQANVSDVGRKGFILGSDNDWNYYYSTETGSARAGLGWVKSYVYDYFSVGVHVQSGSSTPMVRSGVFQWIRAGWSGINFVETKHVISGMKRYARNSKTVLESPRLPAPGQIVSKYRKLSILPQDDLLEKYASLQEAKKKLAAGKNVAGMNEIKKQNVYANTPKEQIVEELMLEYFKLALGKNALLDREEI